MPEAGTAEEPRWVQPLATANKIRLKRAELKRDLAAGRIIFTEVLLDPPEWLGNASIGEMLRSVKGIGKGKVTSALTNNGMSWTRTFDGTPLRQRQALDAWLRDHHPSYYTPPS